MNVIKTFEQRMNDAFGAAPQGFTAPISFKKLAKRAVREMESETFVVDGVDTAPALYTILVASADDDAMRPLYPQITREISSFVQAEGTNRGYRFVGKPLARFMVDPSLRSGRFAVFAENVDARTLGGLRAEEEAFLSGASVVGGAASSVVGAVSSNSPLSVTPAPKAAKPARRARKAKKTNAAADAVMPVASGTVVPVAGADVVPVVDAPAADDAPATPAADQVPAPVPDVPLTPVPEISAPGIREIPVTDPADVPPAQGELSDDSVGLGVIPSDFIDSQYIELAQSQAAAAPAPAPMPAPAPAPAPTPQRIPATQRRPMVGAHAAPAPAHAAPAHAAPARMTPATCVLIDHQSGRQYTATAPGAMIGRERSQGGIVLRDPNVSRRHAQLSFDGRSWHIRDLQSTNGTLVNDVDIDECALRDGDLITVGLMNLEFREG